MKRPNDVSRSRIMNFLFLAIAVVVAVLIFFTVGCTTNAPFRKETKDWIESTHEKRKRAEKRGQGDGARWVKSADSLLAPKRANIPTSQPTQAKNGRSAGV